MGVSLFGRQAAENPEASATRPTGPGGNDGVATGGWLSRLLGILQEIRDDLGGLKKTIRRQRHTQEEFQEQVAEQVASLAETLGQLRERNDRQPVAEELTSRLSPAQVEALTRLDTAIEHLRHARNEAAGTPRSPLPSTSDEALAMLQVRVHNLQHSFGLERIATAGEPFDDRLHRAHSACHRTDLADGLVVEDLLPGYCIGGQLIRPALVIVNRRPQPNATGEQEK